MGTEENNLLHNAVITSLFKNTYLVDLSAPVPTDYTVAQQPQLLEALVIHHYATDHLPTTQQNLLDAIVHACKLTKQNAKAFSHQTIEAASLQIILEKHQPKKIILFGVDPAAIGLPMHFPLFQIQSFQQVQYLHAPSLPDLENDKQLKIQLWQKLKILFP